jgi:hypothetical protein
MSPNLKQTFLAKWELYFGKSELPIVFYYTDDPGKIQRANLPQEHTCIIGELAIVRHGTSLAWQVNTISCSGAKRYLGFSRELRPDFEHFLSKGIEGRLEGERYLRTPELVIEMVKEMRCIPALGKFIVFKRFDKLEEKDDPIAAIFFAKPDVLSGLYTLANYDRSDGQGVIAPYGSGCGIIVHRPLIESQEENPKAILGMFDVSARPCVPKDRLTFSIPMKKFEKMVSYMDESFLITESWSIVRKRL